MVGNHARDILEIAPLKLPVYFGFTSIQFREGINIHLCWNMSPLTKDHKTRCVSTIWVWIQPIDITHTRRILCDPFECSQWPFRMPKPRKEILVQEGQRALWISLANEARWRHNSSPLKIEYIWEDPLLKWIFSAFKTTTVVNQRRFKSGAMVVEDWFPFWRRTYFQERLLLRVHSLDETKPVSEVHGTFQWKKTPVC